MQLISPVLPVYKFLSQILGCFYTILENLGYEKQLARSLEAEKDAYQNELQLITAIFQNDRAIVLNFLNELPETKQMIKDIIDSLEMDKLNKDTIYRLVGVIHSLKGESLSLDFHELGKFCQSFETYLKTIAEQTINLSLNMEIANYQGELNTQIDTILNTAKKIFQFSKHEKEFSSNKISFDIHTYQSLLDEFDSFIKQFQNGTLSPDKITTLQNKFHHATWVLLSNIEKELFLITEKTTAKLNKKAKLQFMFEINSLPQKEYKLLQESFLHLIRNSLAHGIESKEERLAHNKSEEGRINIHITQENDTIIVYYSDDGKGFDAEQIKTHAIKNNLITSEQAGKMSKEDIIQLIFSDGFSTQTKADEISGTGVGMSVVKNNIVNFLHGKIVLENNAPNGMRMKFSFPASK